MLLLSRRIGEQIVIDENVTVTVVGKQGNQIQLGIEAPREVPIRRRELPANDFANSPVNKNGNRRRALTPRSW